MARKIINQQSQAPVSPLILGGFFAPAKISQSGALLRVTADAETTRISGFKDLYLPLDYLSEHFGGIPAGMLVTVTVEQADGASTLPTGSVEQAQRRGPDGRRIGYDTGAAGSMVPPGLIRDQYTPPAPTARITGGRRPMAPVQPPKPAPTAPSGPTAPSEASSLADRVGQLEQGISAILDALAVKK